MNVNLKIKNKDKHKEKLNYEYKNHKDSSNSKHNHDISKSNDTINKMLKISLICFCFLIVELIGGIVANSLAILSDAAHLSSDLSGFVISLLSLYISKKKANSKFTFGYHRAEVIGALVSVITIWILTGILIKEAIDRLIKPSEINAIVMLMTSIFGLICNLAMFKVLHSTNHHHHGCNHEENCGNKNDNILNIIDDFKETLENSKEDANILEESSSGLSIFNAGEEHKNGDSILSTDNDKYEIKSEGHEHSQECHDHVGQNHPKHKHHKKKNKCYKSHTHSHNSLDHLHKLYHEDHHNHNYSNTQEKDDLQSDHFHNHEDNVNIKAALIHILGDIIQSIGVVIAAITIYFRPDLIIFDPICTFIFSIIVLITTYKVTKQCVLILMEAVPHNIKLETIKKEITKKFSEIKSIHSIQIWSLSTGKNCISFHAVVEENKNKKMLLVDITNFINNLHKFHATMIQIETSEEFKILNCA